MADGRGDGTVTVRPIALAAVLTAALAVGAAIARHSTGLHSASDAARTAVVGTGGGDARLLLGVNRSPVLDEVVLYPGERHDACLPLESRSTVDPEPLRLWLRAREGGGALAEHLRVRLLVGPRAGVAPCPGVVSTSIAGTLAELLAVLGPDTPGWSSVDPPVGTSQWAYRIALEAPEDLPGDVVGARIDGLDLVWSTVVEDPESRPMRERAVRFAQGVAQDVAVPLVVLAVAALVFLGIHDRFDQADPKLAMAPVDRRVVPFHER